MFDTTVLKNSKRAVDNKIMPIPMDQLLEIRPGERVLPYFEMVPEQFLSDERYQKLTRTQKGDFLQLALLMWRGGGSHLDHVSISKYLDLSEAEWDSLKKALLEAGLLVYSCDGYSFIQPELREQYLHTLAACNAKSRVHAKTSAAGD